MSQSKDEESYLRVCNALLALKDTETLEDTQKVIHAILSADAVDMARDYINTLGILSELLGDGIEAFTDEVVRQL